MELSVGMYVRTELYSISKIIYIEDTNWLEIDKNKGCLIHDETVLKASHNIIDLIEEHDYIRIISSAFFEPVYYSYGKLVIRDDIPIENYSNNFIAEVITHEQMKSMSYKVGE